MNNIYNDTYNNTYPTNPWTTKQFATDSRVRLINYAELTGVTGTVLGPSSNILCIVLLDKPIGINKAMCVPVGCLEQID